MTQNLENDKINNNESEEDSLYEGSLPDAFETESNDSDYSFDDQEDKEQQDLFMGDFEDEEKETDVVFDDGGYDNLSREFRDELYAEDFDERFDSAGSDSDDE